MNFLPGQVIVLPDGVDLSLFDNLPNKKECRRRLGLPIDRPILGYIGRFRALEKEKGLPELVQAMAYLGSFYRKEPLLLCVGGPMDTVSAYLEIAHRFGVPRHRLQFVDRVPNQEVPYWIRACDVVTIPSPSTEHLAYFTSPLKLFEYMAARVPILAADLPSNREILRHGENAWLVEPGKPELLAQGLKRILEDCRLAKNMAEQAFWDAQKYSWRERATKILQLLNNR